MSVSLTRWRRALRGDPCAGGLDRRKLAAADPGNPAVSDRRGRAAALREALAIAEALAREGKLTAAQQGLACRFTGRAREAAAGGRRGAMTLQIIAIPPFTCSVWPVT